MTRALLLALCLSATVSLAGDPPAPESGDPGLKECADRVAKPAPRPKYSFNLLSAHDVKGLETEFARMRVGWFSPHARELAEALYTCHQQKGSVSPQDVDTIARALLVQRCEIPKTSSYLDDAVTRAQAWVAKQRW